MDDALAQGEVLDALAAADERERVERRVEGDDHVEVRALVVGSADGVGLEDLRLGDDAAELAHGEAQVALAVAEVGAEGDDRPVGGAGAHLEVGGRAADAHGGGLHLLGDRRPQLGHRQLDGLDPGEADDDLGDAVGEAFEQDVLVLPHDSRHLLGDEAVVDGVAELVAAPGVAQVDEEGQVDAQRLGHLPLVRQGADHRRDEEARDVDPIAHGWHLRRQGVGSS